MVHTREVTIHHKDGLHLRPAALFVQRAASFESVIQVRNITRQIDYQDGKSAIGVMMLKVNQGDEIEIRAEGTDARDAVEDLVALIESRFAG